MSLSVEECHLLEIVPSYMKEPEQEFFTNIKSTTYSNQLEDALSTTMDEADMLLWLQYVHCTGSKVLVYNPDTDDRCVPCRLANC